MDNRKIINDETVAVGRLTSVDFFRGFTMFLLMGESTSLYEHLGEINTGLTHFLGTQLSHHEWHGLRFWDLIQPFFMFIVGVAIPFAVANRRKKGDSDSLITKHAIKRALLLLFLGWALYCLEPGKIVWRFQNVLAQLSVTYLVAFLIRDKSFTFQLVLSVAVLIITDIAYRVFPVEGFNQPWEAFHNLGAWVNIKIEGTPETSIWASLNAIPTIAHTVWGVLCGKLLMSSRSATEKIKYLVIAGLAALFVGYTLDLTGVTPIIKKIATMSFVFVSGGYAMVGLAFSYWLIDVKKIFVKGSKMFLIVGMNCIFIYLFFSIGGAWFVGRLFVPFTKLLFSWGGDLLPTIMNSAVTWAALWYMTYWLYRNRILIKL